MKPLDEQQQAARDWFEVASRPHLRGVRGDRARGRVRTQASNIMPWDRTDASGEPGGGGVRGQMTGKVFEKVGVNVSTVGGQFSPEFAKQHPRRRRGPELLRHRHQPGRAHGEPARPRGPHEHALPDHDQALVRRRRGPQSGDSLRGGHRSLPRPPSRRVRGARPDLLSALLEVGGRIFLHSAPRRSRAASAEFSTITSTVTSPARARRSTRISPSPATSARRSSTSSRSSSASGWTRRSMTPTSTGC